MRGLGTLAGGLAYGTGLWLVVTHEEGGHAQAGPPFVWHWLRDSTLALPAVALAVATALLLARRLVASDATPELRLSVSAVLVACATALAFGAGALVHPVLFPAELEGVSGLAHVARDAWLALLAALPLAGALIAFTGADRGAPRRVPAPTWGPPPLGATLEGAGARAGLVLEAGTTRRRFVQYGAAGAALLGSSGALRAYAASIDSHALSDRKNPCFDKSPRVAPFSVLLPVPPVLEPVRRTAEADVYEIVETASTSEIIPGIRTPIWGYNGITPGPTIMARRGRPVHVTVTNALPRDGDPQGLIVVRPPDPEDNPYIEPGTVTHLHGINADPISDGYATDVRLPGDSLLHRYPNNEDQHAATLWYHDHSVHIAGHHLFRGLVGLYILTDEVEDALPLPKGYGRYDIPLVIEDVMIDPDTGVLLYDNCSDFGAFGDVQLVNGVQQPRLEVAARRYRFRILNASDARQYVLALQDGSTFHTIGSDQGLLDAPVETDNQHLVVSERVEILIDFARYPVGSRVALVNGLEDADSPVRQIMAFDVVRQEADDSELPATLRPSGDPAPPSARRRFELEHRGSYWAINGLRWDQNRVDAFPMLNTTEDWEYVTKGGGWGHPMHMHLGRFKILSIAGRERRPDENGWKDTVWVGPNQTVVVRHEFKNFTGRFLFHCHNSSHEDHTMMSQFEVIPGPPADGPGPPRTPEPAGTPQQVPPPPESTTTPPAEEFRSRRPKRRRKRRRARRRPRRRARRRTR